MFVWVENSAENESERGQKETGIEGLGQMLQTGDGESGKTARRDFMLQDRPLSEESYRQSVSDSQLLKVVLAEGGCESSFLNTESAGEKMKGLVGLHGEK